MLSCPNLLNPKVVCTYCFNFGPGQSSQDKEPFYCHFNEKKNLLFACISSKYGRQLCLTNQLRISHTHSSEYHRNILFISTVCLYEKQTLLQILAFRCYKPRALLSAGLCLVTNTGEKPQTSLYIYLSPLAKKKLMLHPACTIILITLSYSTISMWFFRKYKNDFENPITFDMLI